MSFENPFLFFLLLIPTLILAYLVLTNKNGLERVFSPKILELIQIDNRHLSSRARNFLLFLSIFFMIIAISHPYIKKGDTNIKVANQSIVIALNLSSSMRIKDRYPNRLEFAKQKINYILDKMINDEITLLTFFNYTYLISPSTSDIETLKNVLNNLDIKYLQGYANYENLAKSLSKILKNKLEKSVIIITDTDSNSYLGDFEKIIKNNKLKVYIIYVATKKGDLSFNKEGKLILKDNKVLINKLDIKLGNIVKKYGGDYIVATYSNENLNKLIREIKNNSLTLDKNKEVVIKERVELFYYPLIIAFVLLISALSSIPKENIFKKTKVKK